MRPAILTIFAGLLLLAGLSPLAVAHSPGQSDVLVTFHDGAPSVVTTQVALIDLLQILPLDKNRDAQLSWGEISASSEAILEITSDASRMTENDMACTFASRSSSLSFNRSGGVPLLRIVTPVRCPSVTRDGTNASLYTFGFDLFTTIDPTHRTVLRVADEEAENLFVLSGDNPAQTFNVPNSGNVGMTDFVVDGFRHILDGYDHLAFLLLLILPVAGSDRIRQRLVRTAKIVTAFTAAHSITLAAAITGLVHLPARPVEIAIAASVVLAGLANVFRPLHAATWKIAFAFGLLHGFGFAGALQALEVRGQSLVTALLGFNIGIELGQLAVVLFVLPLLGILALSHRYRSVVVPGASLACAALGVVWTAGRLQF